MRPTLALLPLLLCACVQTVTVRESRPEPPQAVVSVPTRVWRVEQEGVLLGYVLRFSPSTSDHASFHSVRNVWNQELGLVDGEGRAWRYRPHGEEPAWLSTGPVSDGVRTILGLEESGTDLVECSLDELAP